MLYSTTMKSSCGALFYSYNPQRKLGIILGLEGLNWLPFKGCNESGETLEQTAIREIKEETCGLVNINSINLEHRFTSKRKHYFIGLCEVPYDIIEEFSKLRLTEDRIEYREKKILKFFPLDTILDDNGVHNITKASVKYFWNHLQKLNKDEKYVIQNTVERIRKQSIPLEYAKSKYQIVSDKLLVIATAEDITSESSDSSQELSPVSYSRDNNTSGDVRKCMKSYSHSTKRITRRPSTLLRQPAKLNIYNTSTREHQADLNRVWRQDQPAKTYSRNIVIA
jgi:hypothetical protein